MEQLKALLEKLDWKRFLKFGLIGVLNTLVDFAVFYVLDTWIIKDGPTLALLGITVVAGPYLSNFISYVVANIHSFLWNKFWTFQKKDKISSREVGRYLATSLGYVILSTVSLAIFMAILGTGAFSFIPEKWVNLAAKVPTVCVTIFYNYLMNKFWVFR